MQFGQKRNLFDDDCEIVVGTTLLSSPFYLDESLNESVILVLTPKFVFYHKKDNKQKRKGFVINFQTIFQILRTKLTAEEKGLGKAYGLKFMNNDSLPQQFFTDNQKDLEKWQIQLRKYLNQFNFHDLFKAEKRLGKGNFATVYLGVQKKDNKKMAIKAFGKEATYSQQNGKQAIINQVRITRMFNHPNLMKMQGVYESENSVYFSLEYIEGTPISGRLNHFQKYTEVQRRSIMKGILQGLSEMARKNVIHRDLKPDNILVGKEPVIIDFGLATVADEPKYLFVRCGTPGYVAPQIINIKDLSTKSQPISDVFSAGCIFYYIVFNKHLFMAKNGQDIIALNRQCDLVLSGSQFDKINSKEADLMRKMLQKEPQLRISAAEALKHPYFTDADDKIFIPKILMKQCGSCPIELLETENEAAVKFITTESKNDKKQASVKVYDRSVLKNKVDKVDINKWLINV